MRATLSLLLLFFLLSHTLCSAKSSRSKCTDQSHHDELITSAREALIASKLDAARKCLDLITSSAPAALQQDAFVLRSAISMRLKQHDKAEEYARSALAFPGGSQVSASLSLAAALAARGKIQASHDAFSIAATASGHATDVYDEWSNMLFNAGQRETAARVLQQGALHNPRWFGGRLGAAIVLRDLRHSQDAIQLYNEALAIEPSNARAYYSFGNLFLDAGDHVRALPLYQTAVALDPNQQDYWNNKGNTERALGDLAAAEQSLRKGLQLPPEQVSLLLNLAQVLQDRGETIEVRALAERAIKIAPNQHQAQLQMGSVLYKEDRLRESVEHYKIAVALAPQDRQALLSLANTLGDAYRQEAARTMSLKDVKADAEEIYSYSLRTYTLMLRLNPRDDEAFMNKLWFQKWVCDWRGWASDMHRLRRVLDAYKSKASTAARSGRASLLQLYTSDTPSGLKPFMLLAFPITPLDVLLSAQHHAWDEQRKALKAAGPSWPPFAPPPVPSAKHSVIRLGYVSSDLKDHPVGHQAWFHRHTGKFSVHAYMVGVCDGSAWEQRIRRSVTTFTEASSMSDVVLAHAINKAGIDVLVSMNGWTAGHRMGVMSLQPAPVSIEWMGGHDTTGADYVTYIVSDRVASPPEFSQPFYSEAMMMMPNSFFMNEYKESRASVLSDSRPSRSSLSLPPGPLLCNFNQLFKLDPQTLAAWVQLLHRVPQAHLWLLQLPFSAQSRVIAAASALGLPSSRLIFHARTAFESHLLQKQNADLALDMPLFNSHTSGCDILWAGVPLLTLPTSTMSGRVAASLLRAALPSPAAASLIARTLDDYVDIAAQLLQRPHRLQQLRVQVESSRNTSHLFDTQAMTRDFEGLVSCALELHRGGWGARGKGGRWHHCLSGARHTSA